MSKLAANPTQNHASQIVLIEPEISGEIGPGPIRFGAIALATIVDIEPSI